MGWDCSDLQGSVAILDTRLATALATVLLLVYMIRAISSCSPNRP